MNQVLGQRSTYNLQIQEVHTYTIFFLFTTRFLYTSYLSSTTQTKTEETEQLFSFLFYNTETSMSSVVTVGLTVKRHPFFAS